MFSGMCRVFSLRSRWRSRCEGRLPLSLRPPIRDSCARNNSVLQRVMLDQRGMPLRRESMLTELKMRIREVRQGPDGLVYLPASSPAKPGAETIRGGRISPGQPPVEEDDETGALLRIEPVTRPIETRSRQPADTRCPADRWTADLGLPRRRRPPSSLSKCRGA